MRWATGLPRMCGCCSPTARAWRRNTARLTNHNRTELRRGVYSPCDLCKNDPSAPPAWQFVARQIDHDKEFEADRDARRNDGNRRVAGLLHPLHLDARPHGQARERLSAPSFGSSSSVGVQSRSPISWCSGRTRTSRLSPRFTSKAGRGARDRLPPTFGDGELDALGSINYSNPADAQINRRSAARQYQRAQRVRRQRGLAHRVSTCSASSDQSLPAAIRLRQPAAQR